MAAFAAAVPRRPAWFVWAHACYPGPASCLADYLCPVPEGHPLTEQVQPQLAAYMCSLFPRPLDAPPRLAPELSWQPLAEALRTYAGVTHTPAVIVSIQLQQLLGLWQLVQALQQPAYAAAVDAQLAALQPSVHPPLSAAQLQHAAAAHLIDAVCALLQPKWAEERAADPGRVATLLEALRTCMWLAVALEPANPKSQALAAHGWYTLAVAARPGGGGRAATHALQQFRACFQQAQNARDGFYLAKAGAALLSLTLCSSGLGVPADAEALQAAVEAFAAAEAALKRSKGL